VKILVAVFFLFLVLPSFAQSPGKIKLSGTVVDSLSQSPLEYASISVVDESTSKVVHGGVTDRSGRFILTGLGRGSFTIQVESIGYKPSELRHLVIDDSKATVELPTFSLAVQTSALQTVTVTTTGKLVTNKIDKLIYNAERDITSQSGVATDVLRKVPQVSVDINGNVELAGSTSIRFLINGKPSTAFGNNVAEVLQSIPASQIKAIEVVTNPGAKYDAQGLGGIINIVLKKNNAQGVNGNVSLAAGTRSQNGSFNFNARKGNFGANAYVSGNYRPAFNTLVTTDRIGTDTAAETVTVLHQDGSSHFSRGGFETGAGFDWTPTKKSSLEGSFSYERFGNEGHASIAQRQTISGPAGNIINDQSTQAFTNGSFLLQAIDVSLGYKLAFDKEDQELEIGVNSSFGRSLITSDNYQLLLPNSERFYGNNSRNPGKENETEVNIDYVHPLKDDIKLGIGTKYTFVDIEGNADAASLQPTSGLYVHDPYLSNQLTYRQNVYAAYAELGFPVGKLLEAKIGGRYEATGIDSYFSNAQQQAKAPGYQTFVPSVFLMRKIGEDRLVKLSYSKRINRPDYEELNPFINTSDPKNLTTGNPFLKPELSHRVELAYNQELGKAGSFSATIFYRRNEADIQPFVRYYPTYQVGDSVYHNIAVTRRENIGQENNTGLMLFSDLHPGDKLTVRMNLMAFHRYTINQLDQGYNTNSFNYRFNINATYQFSPTLVSEFFGNFNSARNEAQGKYPSTMTYSFAVRKQFWNKKGSLALTTTNPFANYLTQQTSLSGPGFTSNSVRQIPIRSFAINFTWKFGGLEFKKEKDDNENVSMPVEN
jgi:ferric enterobactin receptor